MNCNAIKNRKSTKEDVIKAVEESKEVELNEDKSKIRRAGNKALPALKRKGGPDAENGAKSDDPKVLYEDDFKNPLVLQYKVKEGEDKLSWKAVEEAVRAAYPSLRIVYVRGDELSGHLSIS